jgi:hypothetical protein
MFLKALNSEHFAFDLITKMIQPTPERRPKINDIMFYLRSMGPKSPPIMSKHDDLSTLPKSIFVISQTAKHVQQCYTTADAGIVYNCRFHPKKLKLACVLKGNICVFKGDHNAPFSNWTRITFERQSKSHILCIDWKVNTDYRLLSTY